MANWLAVVDDECYCLESEFEAASLKPAVRLAVSIKHFLRPQKSKADFKWVAKTER